MSEPKYKVFLKNRFIAACRKAADAVLFVERCGEPGMEVRVGHLKSDALWRFGEGRTMTREEVEKELLVRLAEHQRKNAWKYNIG